MKESQYFSWLNGSGEILRLTRSRYVLDGVEENNRAKFGVN